LLSDLGSHKKWRLLQGFSEILDLLQRFVTDSVLGIHLKAEEAIGYLRGKFERFTERQANPSEIEPTIAEPNF
jgi:hypothetical protein